jgi:hypothetical protein
MNKSYFSNHPDADAIKSTLQNWRDSCPGMGVLALVSEQQSPLITSLQVICRELNLPVIGGIFPAVIWQQQFHRDGILLIKMDKMPDYLLESDLPQNENLLRKKIVNISKRIRSKLTPSNDHSLCLIFDSMLPNIASILDELYLNLANQVEYTGVNAGSETFQPIPCLFDGEHLIDKGVLILILPRRINSALEHGYTTPGEMITATATEGNRIINIDWQPAFEQYQSRIKQQYDVEITQENFYQYAVHFPFGIIRGNGEIQVRIPVVLNEDDSLFCVGEVPANSLLALLTAPIENSQQTVKALANNLGKVEGGDILNFYCAGRRLHLGESAAQSELKQLQQELNTELFGALSLGEIGSSQQGGYPLFHNAAIVCCQI